MQDDRPHRRAYQQGDHVCMLYDTPEEQISVAAQYVADGLRNGERCLYVAQPNEALDRFRSALEDLGIDVPAAEARESLLLMITGAAHLVDGRFDSERMLAMLNAAVEDALDAGFKGLRTCGDMSWLLDDAPGSEQVVEYEALLNGLFPTVRALGMCQYDKSRLPPGLLDCAISTHTSVVVDGAHRHNPFFRAWPFDYGAVSKDDVQRKLVELHSHGD